jgi:hypothetical protein
MKKFKCIATVKVGEKKTTTFKSVKFSVVAASFKEALIKAEKRAKFYFVFESLKVSEV